MFSLVHYFNTDSDVARLRHPPWICQPYVRISPEEHLKKMANGQLKALEGQRNENNSEREKRSISEDEPELSKKKQKKLQRNPRKNFNPPPPSYEKCICKNPRVGCRFKFEAIYPIITLDKLK